MSVPLAPVSDHWLAPFSLTSRLVFFVVGAMVDVKLVALPAGSPNPLSGRG